MRSLETARVEAGRIALGETRLSFLLEPATAEARVTWREQERRLRPWTFAERRRLLGLVDPTEEAGERWLLAEVGRRFVDPPCSSDDDEALCLAALLWSLSGGHRELPAAPGVSAAEQLAVLVEARFSAEAIERAPAADVDRWYAACVARAAVTPPLAASGSSSLDSDGVTRYLLVED